MKTTITFIVLALIIVGGIYLGKNNSSDSKVESTNESVLSSDKKTFDFGDIDIFGGKVETEFALTNEGSDPITIIAGTTSCGCTEGEIGGISFGMHTKMRDNFVVQAGETQNLKVIFDPMAHGPNATGKIDRQVFLKTDSVATPELEVRIMANVTKEDK